MIARSRTTKRTDHSATRTYNTSGYQLRSPEQKRKKPAASPVKEERGRWDSGTSIKRTDSRQNTKQQSVQAAQTKQATDIQRQKVTYNLY